MAEKSMENEVLMDAVLGMDGRVRQVTIISEDLKQIRNRMQVDAVSYSPKFIDEVVVPILAGILKRLTEYIGTFDYCLMSYEKVKVLIFRLRESFLLVSVEPSMDVPRLIEKIAHIASR